MSKRIPFENLPVREIPDYHNAAQWLREMHEQGLMYHMDDDAREIMTRGPVDTGQWRHTFHYETARYVNYLMGKAVHAFVVRGLCPFGYVLDRLMKETV